MYPAIRYGIFSSLLLFLSACQSSSEATVIQENGACVPSGHGTDYSVGPGQSYASLGNVPWDTLGPGDTVRIFYKPTPYKEKIVIRTGGTPENPLRICGVSGSNGERPVIDGNGARNIPADKAAYTDYTPMEGLAVVMIYNRDYDLKDSNIIIDNLHIKNGKNTFNYIRTDGSSNPYEEGAACIRVQAGDNIVIRNNELENCGNGIFTMSQGYNEAHLTRNILIEGNYLHGHGQANSGRQHALYIQAIGATYQYNRFGPNTPRSSGTTLKERVAGSLIRYNWFESGSSRALDLVEVEDAAPWYIEAEYRRWAQNEGEPIDAARLATVREAEAAYRKTYVYGNFFEHIGSRTVAGSLVHYGWDNDPLLSRKGVLYFYNNTVSIRQDRDDSWRFRLFDMRLYNETPPVTPAQETVEAFNNIVYFAHETNGAEAAYLCMGNNSGTINLGVNWISNGWQHAQAVSECYPYADSGEHPVVTGLSNLVDTTDVPLPIKLSTLSSNNIESIRNQSQPLSQEAKNYPVTMQYVPHQQSQERSHANDLGAMQLNVTRRFFPHLQLYLLE